MSLKLDSNENERKKFNKLYQPKEVERKRRRSKFLVFVFEKAKRIPPQDICQVCSESEFTSNCFIPRDYKSRTSKNNNI